MTSEVYAYLRVKLLGGRSEGDTGNPQGFSEPSHGHGNNAPSDDDIPF